jgi:alpha-beta hydrolase superfamily lysophospholipase
MDHFEGTFAGHDGLELYTQRWRPAGGGPPKATLAVVHGFGEHSGRYGNVVDWFVPKGYAVHAFDLRGHGRSPGQRGYVNRFSDYTGDVRAFLAVASREEPGRPVFLVGHSMGGPIVLNTVLHDPSGLAGVVASGALLAQLPVSPGLTLLAKVMSRIRPNFTAKAGPKSGPDVATLSRDPAVIKAYLDDPLVHGLGTARLGTELTAAIDWTQAHAADLALPLLMVHGGADRLCLPEGSRTFFDHVTFADKERREYEGYYHEVFNEVGKEQVLADVEAWIEARLAP